MGIDISREPLQNQIAGNLSSGRSWKMVATDNLGNVMLLDNLSWEIRYDYGTRKDGQPLYMGFAKAGTAEATPTWLIHKFTYQSIAGTDFVIRRETGEGAYSLRTTVLP